MEKSRILGTSVCYVILKEANIHISFICARLKFFLGGGRIGGLRMCHPPYHPPPLIFKPKFKIFVTLPS